MAGIGTALDAVLAGTGTRLVNEGSGGETSHHIAARIGAIPAVLEFPHATIPASGSVPVEIPALERRGPSFKPLAGIVAGVAGVLAWQADTFVFTRAAAGPPVGDDATLRPTLTGDLTGQDALLWMGKNDLADGGGATGVIERTDRAAAWLRARGVRVLVVGHFVNTRSSSEVAQGVLHVNAAHAATHGARFLDCQAVLVDPDVWLGIGVVPSADDRAEQAAGHKPPALSVNDGHLNAAGYVVVAQAIVDRLRELGWIRSGVVNRPAYARGSR